MINLLERTLELKKVPLSEATVYEFMPIILGERFRVVKELRDQVHFFYDDDNIIRYIDRLDDTKGS